MFKHLNRYQWILPLITAILVLLFIYAASSKLLVYNSFKAQLGRSPFISAYAGWVAALLPAAEIIIALLLSFKTTLVPGLYAFAALMLLFTGYIVAMLLSGRQLPCSCGGVIKYLGWKQHLVFNSFFILLSIIALRMVKRQKNIVVQRV